MTEKQKRLLDFIKIKLSETDGVAPSFDEMKDHLDLCSKSGVHRLVKALEEQGHIVRLAHRARTIQLSDGVPVAPLSPRNHVNGSRAMDEIDGVLRDHKNHKLTSLEAVKRIGSIRTFHMGGV